MAAVLFLLFMLAVLASLGFLVWYLDPAVDWLFDRLSRLKR